MAEQIRTRIGQDAKTAIVQTAVQLFGRIGIAQTSLAAIAAELAVTKAAVYHHFANKDAVVAAAFAPLVAAVDDLVTAADAGTEPASRVADRVVDIALEHRELVALCQPGALAGIGTETADQLQSVAAALLGCLADAGVPRSLIRANAFIGALSSVVTAHPNDRPGPDDIAELRQLGHLLIAEHPAPTLGKGGE